MVLNTPTPEPVNKLNTTYYTDSLISMRIPEGWKVNCQMYDSGGGLMRLICIVYDPADTANQLFFCTALEPFFTSEPNKAIFVNILPQYSYAPVISGLNAAEVLKSWPSIYTGFTLTDVTFPKVSAQLNNFTVTDIISLEDGGTINGGIYTCTLANCKLTDGRSIVVSFTDLLSRNIDTGIEFYISYANYTLMARSDLSESYMPVLNECIASLDMSGFIQQSGSGIAAGDDIRSEAGFYVVPKIKINYDLLEEYMKTH